MKKNGAEFIGTFWLVLGGYGSAVPAGLSCRHVAIQPHDNFR